MDQLLNLRQLLQHQVEDLSSAEDQIIEALPKMSEKATSPDLKKALNEHLRITREHKKRLEKIQQAMNKDSKEESEKTKSFLERIFGGGTKCKGMEGLITEGEKMLKEDMDPQVRDAAIIASAQKVEHYEISGYGTARAYANQLSLPEIEKLLQATLDEEYTSDDLLTALALGKVNKAAQDAKRTKAPGKTENRKAAVKKSPPEKQAVKKAAAKKSAPTKKRASR